MTLFIRDIPGGGIGMTCRYGYTGFICKPINARIFYELKSTVVPVFRILIASFGSRCFCGADCHVEWKNVGEIGKEISALVVKSVF